MKHQRLRLRKERLTELQPEELAQVQGAAAAPKTITTCISQLFTNTWSCGGPPDTQLCVS
jgi:hypothetical protein